MVMGRFHGFPDVYPWDKLKVIDITAPEGGDAVAIDLFEEMNGMTRGFILAELVTLECIAWGDYDENNEQYMIVDFGPGTYFGCLRKIKTMGNGSETESDQESIVFFI